MASTENVDKLKSKRLFINQIDQYQGRNIAKYLSKCVVGASLEEEEEDAKSTDSNFKDEKKKEGCYEVVGTLKVKTAAMPSFVKEAIKFENKDQLYEHLVECDVIVYDITQDPDQIDEAVWAVSELHSDLEKIEKPKLFVLISTVMTWAKTKPLDPDDPEIPFTEDDYRRRRPHPNFKDHISAEKTVIKMGKTNKAKLMTFVVATGLTYGAEENIFHYLFKHAWHNDQILYCFGNGQNILPTIHIRDLAAVIQNIADSKPKVRYIIAKDDSNDTLGEIVKAVSCELTSGNTKCITKEEALLNKDMEESDFDSLVVNLRMDGVNVKENMRISWTSEAGIVENMPQIIKEFKNSRGLQPLRVCVLGPPAVGKSTVIEQLCQHYKLHHIIIKTVIEEAIDKHIANAHRTDTDDEEDEENAQESQELLDAINEDKDRNNGRIEDPHVVSFFREKLRSLPCQNQGFILDGFPKTVEQAKELFLNEGDELEESGKEDEFDELLMPNFIFCLEAEDDFLKNRIMNLPERAVIGTHNTEEGLLMRLEGYHTINTEDGTVLNYFDELEFHPEKMDIMKDTSEMMHDTVQKMKHIIGGARNYGPTREELENIRYCEEKARIKKENEEGMEKRKKETEEGAEMKNRQTDWSQRLTEVKREEYEWLQAQSIPLRNYLMTHVMPTLTQGLIDCAKIHPEDPIDYIAEYLFQHNPQVD